MSRMFTDCLTSLVPQQFRLLASDPVAAVQHGLRIQHACLTAWQEGLDQAFQLGHMALDRWQQQLEGLHGATAGAGPATAGESQP